jgi:hypothetical protein
LSSDDDTKLYVSTQAFPMQEKVSKKNTQRKLFSHKRHSSWSLKHIEDFMRGVGYLGPNHYESTFSYIKQVPVPERYVHNSGILAKLRNVVG